MKESEFLDVVRELEFELHSRDFNKWIHKQPEEQKREIRELRTEISNYRSELETRRLKIMADMLDRLAPDLRVGMDEIQSQIDKMEEFISVINLVGRALGLVSRIVTLAA